MDKMTEGNVKSLKKRKRRKDEDNKGSTRKRCIRRIRGAKKEGIRRYG